MTTRRLRIVKYRGSAHGTNEYPFLIDTEGIRVLPVTSLGLQHEAPTTRISTGTPQLDEMLDGRGLYRGSTTLISGTAGSGKTTLAAAFVEAACRRGERALYLAFEESAAQIQRNMRSVGIDLRPWADSGRLRFHASRPTAYGFEAHLSELHRLVQEFRPSVVVFDPVSDLAAMGSDAETKHMLTRAIDYLKSKRITAFFTSLTEDPNEAEHSAVGISSLIDTWILVRNLESNGERNRGLYVLKARGMAHSNQIREFRLSQRGISLLPIYTGSAGVLTGTARQTQEAKERAENLRRTHGRQRLQRTLERKGRALRAQIEAMTTAFESEAEELSREIAEADEQELSLQSDTAMRARVRGVGEKSKSAARRGPRGGRS